MVTKDFTYLLKNPEKLGEEHVNALEKITKEFPYFQPARSLFLKSLKNQGSYRYNQELKTTAAYTLDRNILFEFITSDLFNSKAETNNNKIDTTDNLVEVEIEVDNNANQEKQITKESLKNEAEETLQINKPLEFDKENTHSFSEWLKITTLKPIHRSEKESQDTNDQIDLLTKDSQKNVLQREEKFNLIDEFIANNPKITPPRKNAPLKDITINHSVPSDSLMTETLARVYLAQKNYPKAIQAYKILILKNPEKSGFFADQIKAIKKLHP